MSPPHFLSPLILSLSLAAGPAAADLPVAREVSGIRLLTGGVTLDESTALKRMAPAYRLRLVLTTRSGAYQVAEELQVLKGGQPLLALTDAGPWLLADLPPGNYRLVATVSGQRLEKTLTLGRSPATVHWITPPQLD